MPVTRQTDTATADAGARNAMPTTATASTTAALTIGCTTRSGTFCSSSTSPTKRARRSPRRIEARPSGAIGTMRSKMPARMAASCRKDASWPESRSR